MKIFFKFTNIKNEAEKLEITDKFFFSKDQNQLLTLMSDEFIGGKVEETPSLYIHALNIAFPEVHLYPYDMYNNSHGNANYMIDFYCTSDTNYRDIVKHSSSELTESKFKDYKKILGFIFSRNEKSHELEKKGIMDYKFEPWFVAYNAYINASNSDSVEQAIVLLVSGLEALMTIDNSNLAEQVATRTSFLIENDAIKREYTYIFLKKMYNIRSLTIHGAVDKLRRANVEEFYKDSFKQYFKLRRIFSKVLVKLEPMSDKKTVIFNIDKRMHEAQMHCSNKDIEIS